ncbi:MAG: carbon-nitrogen hydrolase, partial [Flavobacteriaceae bacterium]|nr:carbon-nitrogen hydrolase [Flavobacteriaceae bacterium]
ADGGSAVAGPNGEWLVEPIVHKEGLIYSEIELKRVFEERQNFDPVGHYSRPDVTKLTLNTERQNTLNIKNQ